MAPGRASTSTPAKPSNTASHRQRPAFSPRTSVLRITANSGVVKLKMVATASGSRMDAPKLAIIPTMPLMARPAWLRRRRVASDPSDPRDHSQPSSSGSGTACRQNMISGSEAPPRAASFTSMNRVARARAEPRRRARARKGR